MRQHTSPRKHRMGLVGLLLSIGILFFNTDYLAANSIYGFMEEDIFVTALFQGIGQNVGIGIGPYRSSLGFWSFESKYPSIGGYSKEFKLKINYIAALNIDYFFNRTKPTGLYGRLVLHLKEQLVTLKSTGDEKKLFSVLLGPEMGFIWKITHHFYLAPKIGVLLYLKRPQGKENNPVLVGNRFYDNPKHKYIDFYYSLNAGFVF